MNPLKELAALLTMAIVLDLIIFTVVMLGTASVANDWWASTNFSWLFRK
jgi:hypothetical protein